MSQVVVAPRFLLTIIFLLVLRPGYGQEYLKRTFPSGKGTCQLLDGTMRTGKIKFRCSQPDVVEVYDSRKDELRAYKIGQLSRLTVGADTFVVMRDFWVPRYKQKGFVYVQDPRDTVLVAEAVVQQHLNQGGIELLRYIGAMGETTTMVSSGISGGSGSFYSTEYYTCYLFRQNGRGRYRVIAGEPAPLKAFFAPIVADKPAVRDYLVSTTFVDLKLPTILGLYLTSKVH